MQVTTTSGINVDIIAGQTSSVDFSSATLTYDDNDGDGISNLAELTEGSDPTKPSYYVGGTLSGLLALRCLEGQTGLPHIAKFYK